MNFRNRALDYASQAVLPFYILHHTVMYAVGYYVIQWESGVAFKYAAIATGSLAIIITLYEFGVRRVRFLRFLFGMKPLPKKAVGAGRPALPAPSPLGRAAEGLETGS